MLMVIQCPVCGKTVGCSLFKKKILVCSKCNEKQCQIILNEKKVKKIVATAVCSKCLKEIKKN